MHDPFLVGCGQTASHLHGILGHAALGQRTGAHLFAQLRLHLHAIEQLCTKAIWMEKGRIREVNKEIEQLGVTVKSVGLRDIILPGDVKRLLSQEIEALLKSTARAFPSAPSQPIGAGIVNATYTGVVPDTFKNDAEANERAFAQVRADKEREASDGHDGTWVAHPGLVPIAKEIATLRAIGPT